MANYLALGTMTEPWMLHVDEDPQDVEARLTDAGMRDAEAIVRVVLRDRLEPLPLHVHPARLTWWAIVPLADPDA